MKKIKNTDQIQNLLLKWYKREKRDLPWRKTKDPYAIWISEIMLQQTQVDTVIPYYTRWLKRFPTIQKLARAKEEIIMKFWEGLGYYSRARNIHKSAKLITAQYNSVFPKNKEDILALPGIGLYTLGAISSIAFNKSVPLVDGNVMRVFSRVFNIEENIQTETVKKKMWDIASLLVPTQKPGDFNQALMELGATICIPGTPMCLLCPLNEECVSFKEGTPSKLPLKNKMKTVKFLGWMFFIEKKGHFLIQQRKKGSLMGGLWEFPSFMDGETKNVSDVLKQKMNIQSKKATAHGTVPAAFTKYRGLYQIARCSIQKSFPASKLISKDIEKTCWVAKKDLLKYTFSAPSRKAMEKLEIGSSSKRSTLIALR